MIAPHDGQKTQRDDWEGHSAAVASISAALEVLESYVQRRSGARRGGDATTEEATTTAFAREVDAEIFVGSSSAAARGATWRRRRASTSGSRRCPG